MHLFWGDYKESYVNGVGNQNVGLIVLLALHAILDCQRIIRSTPHGVNPFPPCTLKHGEKLIGFGIINVHQHLGRN